MSIAERDDRKTAALAGWQPSEPLVAANGDLYVHRHALARAILRGEVSQSGFGAEVVGKASTSLISLPVLYLEGQQHQEMRKATARFFAPRTVEESYRATMERETTRLMAQIRDSKGGRLDQIAMDMAVSIAAEIAGLTNHLIPGMPQRIAALLDNPPLDPKLSPAALLRILGTNLKLTAFYLCDVRPSINARRKAPREDLISHLLSIGYRDREILTEAVIFGAAGMVTTREFITIAAIHLLGQPPLRERFLTGSKEERRAILEEILRLEPVIGRLRRRADVAFDLPDGHKVEAGQHFVIDIRSVNADSSAVGACPFHLDPERTMPDPRTGGAAMGFGDGRHRCPGAFIALEESEIFLAQLLALPGLRLVGEPRMSWSELVGGYQFDECRIAID